MDQHRVTRLGLQARRSRVGKLLLRPDVQGCGIEQSGVTAQRKEQESCGVPDMHR